MAKVGHGEWRLDDRKQVNIKETHWKLNVFDCPQERLVSAFNVQSLPDRPTA